MSRRSDAARGALVPPASITSAAGNQPGLQGFRGVTGLLGGPDSRLHQSDKPLPPPKTQTTMSMDGWMDGWMDVK